MFKIMLLDYKWFPKDGSIPLPMLIPFLVNQELQRRAQLQSSRPLVSWMKLYWRKLLYPLNRPSHVQTEKSERGRVLGTITSIIGQRKQIELMRISPRKSWDRVVKVLHQSTVRDGSTGMSGDFPAKQMTNGSTRTSTSDQPWEQNRGRKETKLAGAGEVRLIGWCSRPIQAKRVLTEEKHFQK